MVEGVTVKFRWFRTIETQSNTVQLISVDRRWDLVELHWDDYNLLYESGPTYMVCARHDAALVVDGNRHVCVGFTVVATTFEVNVFLVDDSLNSFASRVSRNNDVVNDAHWSARLNASDFTSSSDRRGYVDRLSEIGSTKSPVYEEALATKDREIADLKFQLGQMKCALIASDDARQCRSAAEMRDSATDCGDLDGVTLDSDDDYDDESLDGRLCVEDPTEVERHLREMRSLRKALRISCRKNKELGEEMLNLRAENARLNRDCTIDTAGRRPCLMDNKCCFSEPDSSSTQYRELPLLRSFASLPAVLGSPDVGRVRRVHHQRPRMVRRPTIVVRPESSLSCCSDSGSLCTDELLSYGTPPLSVGSAGVQTDITAVAGKPKRLVRRSLFADKRTKSSADSVRKKKTASQGQGNSKTRAGERDGDSDDTEDLLLEADKFVATILGAENLEPVVGKYNTFSRKLESGQSTASNYAGFSSANHAARERHRPFIPKCASDLRVGCFVRYLGSTGLVTQGKVTFVGPLTDRDGDFVEVELEPGSNTQGHRSSSRSPNSIFVPFKKVILVCDRY